MVRKLNPARMIFDQNEKPYFRGVCRGSLREPILAQVKDKKSGFTLVELVLVLLVLSLLGYLLGSRLGSFSAWKEDAFLRRLVETFRFIHYQAITDGVPYAIEFNPKDGAFRAGAYRSDSDVNDRISSPLDKVEDQGLVSLELNDYKNPPLFNDENGGAIIPPPSFPSLFEWQRLPTSSNFIEFENSSETISAQNSESFITVSDPRGFSDFCVIHLKFGNNGEKTIFINPFTGIPAIYNGYRDFNWELPGENK